MYAGTGLGLQSAWVSWYDELEDKELVEHHDGDMDEDRQHVIQNQLDEQGYRMSPYFERGPGIGNLKAELAAHGIPYPLKREPTETKGLDLKFEADEDKKLSIKAEVDEEKPVKMELEEKNSIKTEIDEKLVKMELDDKNSIKTEIDEMPVKMELDDKSSIKTEIDEKPVKMELDEKNTIKTEREEEEDVKVKFDEVKNESTNGGLAQARSASSSESKYRGGVRGSRMFVMPSTSGRVTQYKKEDKLAYFQQLAELVGRDRQRRG
ncbi:hypothetical protein BGZ65_012870, partial [Modicella reniformis]